jgi:hypothetical protein
VVERGPEKAGVGGSIPSLATTFDTALILQPRSLARSSETVGGPEEAFSVGGSIPSLATTFDTALILQPRSFARSRETVGGPEEVFSVGGLSRLETCAVLTG